MAQGGEQDRWCCGYVVAGGSGVDVQMATLVWEMKMMSIAVVCSWRWWWRRGFIEMGMALVVTEMAMEWVVVNLVIMLMIHPWVSFPRHAPHSGSQHSLTSRVSVFLASLWPFILATLLSSWRARSGLPVIISHRADSGSHLIRKTCLGPGFRRACRALPRARCWGQQTCGGSRLSSARLLPGGGPGPSRVPTCPPSFPPCPPTWFPAATWARTDRTRAAWVWGGSGATSLAQSSHHVQQ